MREGVTHECVLGEIIGYEETRLVTLKALKAHIASKIEHAELIEDMKREHPSFSANCRVYTLSDYCDGRRSTDLIRFKFCPGCGREIDWKAIKEGKDGTAN